MLVCTHCNSQSVVYDQEYVTGTGWISRPRCLKCGRDKIEDRGSNSHGTIPLQTGEKIAKEASMSKSGICKFEGCTKKVFADWLDMPRNRRDVGDRERGQGVVEGKEIKMKRRQK